MSTSSTLTFSIGSGERKRCSNIAPVRRLRSLAWMKARRLPGVRCSTLNTECRSLLCLMIMPGRIWVAGIDIACNNLLKISAVCRRKAGRPHFPPHKGRKVILHSGHRKGNLPEVALIISGPLRRAWVGLAAQPCRGLELRLAGYCSRAEGCSALPPSGNEVTLCAWDVMNLRKETAWELPLRFFWLDSAREHW